MQTHRRLVAGFISLVFIGAFFAAACGGGGGGDGADGNGAQPPASEPGEELSSEEIVPHFENSAVFILAEGFYGGASSGTGIVLDDEGHILTNNHVVDGAGSLTLRGPDGREIPARIVGRSPCDDLAVVQAREPEHYAPAQIGTVADVTVGSQVYVVGYPGTPSEGFTETRLSLTGGLISKLNAQFPPYGLQNMIQTDASVNHGNSGGPLVDSTGRVVGVVTLAFEFAGLENVAYATTIDEAVQVYDQLLLGEDLDWLGVNAVPNDPQFEVEYGVPYVPDSLVIIGLDTSSPLFEQGWLAGDVLMAAEGQLLSTYGDLCGVVRTHRPGDKILLEGIGQFTDEATGGVFYDFYTSTVELP